MRSVFSTPKTLAPVCAGHGSRVDAHRTTAGRGNLHLAIGLPLHHSEQLTNFLQQLYDPASINYHQYLTKRQFMDRFGPTLEAYQAVSNFAKANGFAIIAIHVSRIVLDVRQNRL